MILLAICFTCTARRSVAIKNFGGNKPQSAQGKMSVTFEGAEVGEEVRKPGEGEDDDAEDEGKSDGDKDKKKAEGDNNDGPSTPEMNKVHKAVAKKVGKDIYNLPDWVQCLIVALVLSVPLLLLGASISCTDVEARSSSICIKTLTHCSFSFVVGWLNCIMLLRYRVFATMMVGNTILAGVAFVCNGGFGTAKEEDLSYYWWTGEKSVRVLCPAQFDNARHYLLMILLFLVGALLHGTLLKKCGWTSGTFAPLIAGGIILVEIAEFLQVIPDSSYDVYFLTPLYGMFVSISAHCGVGSVPWCATGHMTSMAYKLGNWLSDFDHSELSGALINFFVWTSFFVGIMMGTIFHANRTVMLAALYLQGVLSLNSWVHANAKTTDGENTDLDGNANEAGKIPSPHALEAPKAG